MTKTALRASPNGESPHYSIFLRNLRGNNLGAVDPLYVAQSPPQNQNISTVRNVQIVAKPAVSNIARGVIYAPIGLDLLIGNTKSLFVQGVEYIFNAVAPYYFQETRNSIATIPSVSELFALGGLILLGDGIIRLSIGIYRYYANQKLMDATV